MSETTGHIEFRVDDETFHTWYIALGDLKTSSHRPLVVLHGGPGISHRYMRPHLELFASHDIPIIIYDQIGIGKSTHLPDKPASFWTADLFMNELDNLLAHFGIADNFDLLGHSARQPNGLKHLVIASAAPSLALWSESTNLLLDGLPKELRETLKKHEREGTTSDPEYQKGMEIFYAKHVCKLDPWPTLLQESFADMDEDPTVYSTMIGPSEFNITGSLKTWSIIDILEHIRVPTLITNGRDDEAQDVCVKPFFDKIPKAKWVQFSGSHMAFFEEKEWYLKVVGDFLTL